MPTISDVLTSAKGKSLTTQTCLEILKESEGRAGASGQPGHPLQHIADVAPGKGRELLDDYHLRGPAKMQGGNIVPKTGPKAHSQFQNDDQAAAYLKQILESKPGVNALGVLDTTDWQVSIWFGVGGGENFAERSLQLMSTTNPNANFVMWTDRSIRSAFVLLNRVGGGLLHVQTFYPRNDTFPAGAGEIGFRQSGKPNPPGYSVLA